MKKKIFPLHILLNGTDITQKKKIEREEKKKKRVQNFFFLHLMPNLCVFIKKRSTNAYIMYNGPRVTAEMKKNVYIKC